jgi:hypothetical protein
MLQQIKSRIYTVRYQLGLIIIILGLIENTIGFITKFMLIDFWGYIILLIIGILTLLTLILFVTKKSIRYWVLGLLSSIAIANCYIIYTTFDFYPTPISVSRILRNVATVIILWLIYKWARPNKVDVCID